MKRFLKASDQRDIVWFVSSSCYLRGHWPECVARVKRTFCFTSAIDVLQGEGCSKADQRLTRVFFSFVQKHFSG